MLCSEQTLTGFTSHSVLIHPLYCNCWDCEICGPRLQRRLIAIAIAGEPTTLLTLTTNPAHEPDPDRAAAELLRAWQKLSRTYRQRYGRRRWAYLGIWERTQRGMPHLHILLRAPWIDQHEISDFMNAEIAAPIVDIRRVTNARMVANYVAKYVAKQPAKFEGRTRFARSRNWLDTDTMREREAARTHSYGWKRSYQSLEYWMRILSRDFEVERDGDLITARRRDGREPWRRGDP